MSPSEEGGASVNWGPSDQETYLWWDSSDSELLGLDHQCLNMKSYALPVTL
jgi:hypothetical protein